MARELFIGKVEGLDEVIAVLDDLKPKLHDEIVLRMKAEADELAGRITKALPNDPPSSGWEHNGRTAWRNRGSASAKAAGSRPGAGQQDWPVYKIVMGGYASAVADIAGAGGTGDTPQGASLISVLNARVGRASRWVWPHAKMHEARIERRMAEACEKVSDRTSKRIAYRG